MKPIESAPVERFEIGDVDLLRDSADITIHYRATTPSHMPAARPLQKT